MILTDILFFGTATLRLCSKNTCMSWDHKTTYPFPTCPKFVVDDKKSFREKCVSTPLLPPVDAYICCICSRWLVKTLWQNEKLLMMSNFSFCHNVFNSFWWLYLYFWRFSFFCLDTFKTVCCRFVVSCMGMC